VRGPRSACRGEALAKSGGFILESGVQVRDEKIYGTFPKKIKLIISINYL